MTTAVAQQPGVNHYRGVFDAALPNLPGAGLAWLMQQRQQAMVDFERNGLPTLRDEEWKYTNVAAIERRAFTLGGAESAIDATLLSTLEIPAAHRLVFVNGRYFASLSNVAALPAGVRIESLAQALQRDGEALRTLFAALPSAGEHGFVQLNHALFSDGAYIHIAPGVQLEAPIQLLFIGSTADALCATRNVIVAEANAQARVIEHYCSAQPDVTYLANAATHLVLHEHAQLQHIKLGCDSAKAFHVSNIAARLGTSAKLQSYSFALDAQLARTDIRIALDSEDSDCELNGLYVAHGRQHVDHHTYIDHLKPRTTSREVYKGVLTDSARGVFNGKVIVHPDAQQADAQQSNQNLLLSDNAEIDTKPQLEIFADDVKCAHGATVGQLDEEQVFYLRARGLDTGEARSLLTYAFCQEIVDRLSDKNVAQLVSKLLLDRLPDGDHIKELL